MQGWGYLTLRYKVISNSEVLSNYLALCLNLASRAAKGLIGSARLISFLAYFLPTLRRSAAILILLIQHSR